MAQIQRLMALPAPELAVELMPAFGDGTEFGPLKLSKWLGISFDPVRKPILQALQLLEHAELIYVTQ